MPADRRKEAVPSRRRRADDGEEEESILGDVDDDSLSDASANSNVDDDADGEGSEVSADEETSLERPATDSNTEKLAAIQPAPHSEQGAATNGAFKNSADTDAMLNGVKSLPQSKGSEKEIHFDDLGAENDIDGKSLPEDRPQQSTRQESIMERNRREHQEYLKQRDADPAFVPNRGGFFLHDNRSLPAGPSTFRFSARGRGRGQFTGGNYVRGSAMNEPTERPWAHDLHESLTKPQSQHAGQVHDDSKPQPPKQPYAAPNRSFSSVKVLGNVAIHISLPEMKEKIKVPSVVIKQHTLLPQHRPPLRRDKPVRISLPDINPRYIFPSADRSFIFIPRAMRPNQNYNRGRGRGSFHGSRRTSIFGGSGYTPSVAMSRRSSLGQSTPRDGMRSPAISVGRPVVRMPVAVQQSVPIAMTNGPPAIMQPLSSVTRDSQQQVLPMHQPRPQKNVSLADIESPTSFTFNPPQQQEEQPFHQQVPAQVVPPQYGDDGGLFHPHSRRPSHPNMQVGTPLTQIPERAIYAQPFQPYPMFPQQGYYPPPAIFYPPMNPGGPVFNGGIAPQMLPPPFVPGSHPNNFIPAAPTQSHQGITQANMVAHESNGMVFYYDPAQLPTGAQPAPIAQYPAGGVLGMGGMMTPPGSYYYPPAPGPNGMYFAPQ